VVPASSRGMGPSDRKEGRGNLCGFGAAVTSSWLDWRAARA
jgi:hypothetical protein